MTTIEAGNGTSMQINPDDLKNQEDVTKWYPQEVKISDSARQLLERYAELDADDVVPHVRSLRTRAFKIFPYPCIGHVRFLELTTSMHPDYNQVVFRVQSGQTYLDAGCCLGQDLRKLLYDGAPSSAALYGLDVEEAFFGLGKELFRDADRLEATFVAADLTRSLAPKATLLESKIDIISAQSLFHLFDLQDQKTIAKHLLSFARQASGSMIFGRQVGNETAGVVRGLSKDSKVFAHSAESLKQFWEEAGLEMGTSWRAHVTVGPPPERLVKQSFTTPGVYILFFTVLRA